MHFLISKDFHLGKASKPSSCHSLVSRSASRHHLLEGNGNGIKNHFTRQRKMLYISNEICNKHLKDDIDRVSDL